MIELTAIQKTFATPSGQTFDALKDVNLVVPPGHIHGVIGRSGAGKSTLLRCVNLLERPDSGTVRVAGQDLLSLDAASLNQARRQIGMVFQHFNLLSTQTVSNNIAFPLRLAGFSQAKQRKCIGELLERVGLSSKANAYPSQLSGGQKQRVAIARALATKPSILLCDEMTSALDPESTQSILNLVREIQADLSLTVLLITHEMDVIKRMASEVTVMDDARVIEQGSTAQIFTAPTHSVTRQLVDSTEHMVLPDKMQQLLSPVACEDSLVLLELSFSGTSTSRPVIGASMKKFGVEINILQANVSYLRDTLVGKMIIACDAAADLLQNVERFYRDADINVERLGYVKRDYWPFS